VGNIKLDFRETGQGDMDWTDMAQDKGHWRALLNMAMAILDP
jgi:hypothetical protein